MTKAETARQRFDEWSAMAIAHSGFETSQKTRPLLVEGTGRDHAGNMRAGSANAMSPLPRFIFRQRGTGNVSKRNPQLTLEGPKSIETLHLYGQRLRVDLDVCHGR